jgi:hypothetical protein
VPAAVAVSEHPVPAESTGDVVGLLLDAGMEGAEMVVLAVAPGLVGAIEDVAGSVQALLGAGHCLGFCTAAVVGGGRRLGASGIAALAVSGVPWHAAEIGPGLVVPDALSMGAAPGLVVTSVAPRLPMAPGSIEGVPQGHPGSILLDGTCSGGAALWCDQGSGVQVVEVGGWRPLGPTRSAGCSGGSLVALDAMPANEVLVAELAAMAIEARQSVLDVALRRCGSAVVEELVALEVDPRTAVTRTSTSLVDGEPVEVVVRDAGSLCSEIEHLIARADAEAALVCSPLLGPRAVVGDAGRGATRLAVALGDRCGGLPVAGIALGMASGPPPVTVLLCSG